MVNKTQVRDIPFSDRVSLHTCVPFAGKRLRGPATVTKGTLVEVMNHGFRSEHPHPGNRSAFRRSVAPGDFHLKRTSGVFLLFLFKLLLLCNTKSLRRLYTGRDQFKTAFEVVFLLLGYNIVCFSGVIIEH